MDGRFNTIAGWVLGSGIVFLGATLVSKEIFKDERPATMGYPIAGVEEETKGGAAAEQPIAFYLQTADAGRGEAVFRRCVSCHTATQGGANGIGPNLWGSMGANVAHRADYSYSDPLKSHGGRWDWDTMAQWLHAPGSFARGTKMTFVGIADPQERADVMLFLNQHGGNLQLPPPPAAAPAAAGGNEAGANATEGNEAAGNAAAPANSAAPAAKAAAPAGGH